MREILKQLTAKAEALLDNAVECEDTKILKSSLEALREVADSERESETSQEMWEAISNLAQALGQFVR